MVKKTSTGIDGEVLPPERDANDSDINQGGHPPHAPTQKFRDSAETLAGYGVPQRDIATLIGISLPTLRKHYAHELQLGTAKAKAKLAQAAWRMAWGSPVEYDDQNRVIHAEALPDKTMMIFLCKTQLHWVEQYRVDLGAAGGGEDAESVDGMTNRERRQEIEALLKIADSRKPVTTPKPPTKAKGNGSDNVH